MALQRALFTAKPTPNFWRKVSKLVPGKSAQDCFDKVNSDHMTLPQTFPRSRAKRINSSTLECFSISVSKLLNNPSGPKNKRLSCKQKSHLAHKNVRELLQKQNQVNRDYEADLFSILEPNQNSSMQDSKLAVEISTPEHSQEKLGFLHKLHESSSDHKRPLVRLSSCGIDIVSPPVLKQVKNKALHVHVHVQENLLQEKRIGERSMKIDVVRAAKNTLVSDVRDAIYQLQDVQTNAGSASDFLDDDVGSDDDGGESIL